MPGWRTPRPASVAMSAMALPCMAPAALPSMAYPVWAPAAPRTRPTALVRSRVDVSKLPLPATALMSVKPPVPSPITPSIWIILAIRSKVLRPSVLTPPPPTVILPRSTPSVTRPSRALGTPVDRVRLLVFRVLRPLTLMPLGLAMMRLALPPKTSSVPCRLLGPVPVTSDRMVLASVAPRFGLRLIWPAICERPSTVLLLNTTPGATVLSCWNWLCDRPWASGAAILTIGTPEAE